ncbi:MAG: hypothetical protein J5962_03025 [Lachnospiraceae bacterium]|nr:hypothetical protein [Lachnospiraceae bacterium]
MAINSVSGTQFVPSYSTYETKAKSDGNVEEAAADAGVIYEKSQEQSDKTPYSINRMSQEDRSALVEQLKTDQENRMKSLMSLVSDTITGQAKSYGIAVNDDEVWKLFADGKVTVDEAARKQAQEDISEDGYWGVKQTSQRLFDFASALAGDDVDTMKAMQKAMEKGFGQAAKAWGKELPQISQDTKEAADKLFEEYYQSKTVQ